MSTNAEPEDDSNLPADEFCPKHGHYANLRPWDVGCFACKCAGDAYTKRTDFEGRRNQRLRESGLIGWTKRATFENFAITESGQQKALDCCKAFVTMDEKREDTPWLLGPPGTGKTHLGCAMVNYLIGTCDTTAAIYSAREIVKMLRATWGKRHEQESDVVEKLSGLSLLVIDEVGINFGSDSEIVQLFDVIDMRYRLERPTALISNLTAPDLKPVLGDAAYDRLREGAKLVPMKWPSHRGSVREF